MRLDLPRLGLPKLGLPACLMSLVLAGCASTNTAIDTRDAVLVLDKAPA